MRQTSSPWSAFAQSDPDPRHGLRHDPQGTLTAVTKMNSAELQGRVADACLQFHGGWGYMREMAIAHAWADARQARIAGGSIEIMKPIIAK